MLRSKTTVFVMIGALVLMTGAFTAVSPSDPAGATATTADIDEFVLVNGDEVAEADFISRLASVEQSMVMLQAQAETAPNDDEQTNELLDILEVTPAETIALASLILDMAIYQEAVERGHLPDREVITQQVEQERQTFEMIEADPDQFGVDPADVERYRDNIEEIGEARYWSEYYPQIMEQQMAVQQLQMATQQTGEDWIEIQRSAFNGAEIVLGDPDAVSPATVTDAGAYLNRIWELTQS